MRVTHWAFLFVAALILAASCNSGDQPLEVVDPEAAPQDPDFELVFNIIHNECASCHSGEDEDDAPSRAAAGVEPPLDTCEDIFDQRDAIWREVVRNTMPPGAWPRLSSTEKLIIERWLENGAKAPCR